MPAVSTRTSSRPSTTRVVSIASRVVPASSDTITTLATFNVTNGAGPADGVVEDASGDIFGTATAGGAFLGGTVFEVQAGSGNVTLLAGTGGIAGNASDSTAEIATTGAVALDSYGPIGTSSNRIQFDAGHTPSSVSVGATLTPSSVYLDGLGNLTLGSVHGAAANTTLDVTARSGLTVAAGALISTGTGTISLAAARPCCRTVGLRPPARLGRRLDGTRHRPDGAGASRRARIRRGWRPER